MGEKIKILFYEPVLFFPSDCSKNKEYLKKKCKSHVYLQHERESHLS